MHNFKGGCVKTLTQPFMRIKPRLSQARALLLPKVFVSLGIKFFVMAKLHFRPYIPNQTVLFPQRIDENIAATDPVRIVNAVIDNLNLESFKKLYKETGRCPYHPKMMLKVIIYAYMNNIYSCRKMRSTSFVTFIIFGLPVMSIRILSRSTVFVTV